MATKKKLLQAAAGSAGGAALNVEDVFSTYLYDGNSSSSTTTTQKITNDIDLSTEGGLVWIKKRNGTAAHALVDTERGGNKELNTAASTLETTADSSQNIAFNTDGFTMTGYYLYNATINKSSETYASWTFRKAPKFFDVVTWTGDGTTDFSKKISHSIGARPGLVIAKNRSRSSNWMVWYPLMDNADYNLHLNNDNQTQSSNETNGRVYVEQTGDYRIQVKSQGTGDDANRSGDNYVAYVFANNDGDGEFGPTGDQDIIKCGSFTDSGSSSTPTDVNLGFEPQWLLVKASSTSSDWYLLDMMREMSWNDGRHLRPNLSNAETNFSVGYFKPTPTGFQFRGDFFGSGQTAIYIAIRRGPMAVPTDATDVFGIDRNDQTAPTYEGGFPVDMGLIKQIDNTNSWLLADRLRGESYLVPNATDAESTNSAMVFDYMEGWNSFGSSSAYYSWMWKRAPSFCDVVAYTGNGTAGRTVSHNLGVAPEMIWVKARSKIEDWSVYHAGITNPEQNYLYLNNTGAVNQNANTIKYWNHTNPTDSVFTLGDESRVNLSGHTYIAYLFASLDGVSKVGSYTGDGTTDGSNVVDCGFSSGARFILVKSSNSATNWGVFDTARGITSGNDPRLRLNTTDAEFTTADFLVPTNSGFAFKAGFNTSGNTYIFYAIA